MIAKLLKGSAIVAGGGMLFGAAFRAGRAQQTEIAERHDVRLAALESGLEAMKGEIAERVKVEIQSALSPIEEAVLRSLELKQSDLVHTAVAAAQGELQPRLESIERSVAEQSQSVGSLTSAVSRTSDSLQQMLDSLEKLWQQHAERPAAGSAGHDQFLARTA